jgi:Flp pilus assembly protein TadG
MRRIGNYLFNQTSEFRSDERGAVAILFALMAVALIGMAMSAIDVARIERMRAGMQVAADAAAAAGAQLLGSADEQVDPVVKAYLIANLPPDQKNNPYKLTIDPDKKSLTINLQNEVPTTLVGLLDVNSVRIFIESTGYAPVQVAEVPTDSGEEPAKSKKARRKPPERPQPPQLSRGTSRSDMQANQEKIIEYLRALEKNGDPEVSRLLEAFQRLR